VIDVRNHKVGSLNIFYKFLEITNPAFVARRWRKSSQEELASWYTLGQWFWTCAPRILEDRRTIHKEFVDTFMQ